MHKLSSEAKRKRALDEIKKFKRAHKGKVVVNHPAYVERALQTLSETDDRPIIPNYGFPAAGHHHVAEVTDCQHRTKFHLATHAAAISLNGELVPVGWPTSPEDHDASLGWREPHDEPTAQPFTAAGDSLQRLVSWILGGHRSTELSAVGLRAVVVALATRPGELAGNDELNMQTIAERFGITRQAISKTLKQLTAELSGGRFECAMQRQGHHATRAKAARNYHREAGHTLHD